jgi:hypothetical protein
VATVTFIPTSKLIDLLRLTDPDGLHQVRVLTPRTLSVENNKFQQIAVLDLAKEQVIDTANSSAALSKIVPAALPPEKASAPVNLGYTERKTRKSGKYEVYILGVFTESGTLKEALAAGLMALEQARPGTLERLSRIMGNTKRIVAKDRAALFSRHDLVIKYSERLDKTWWYGTNNSSKETESWLEKACDCAGLKWGTEVKVSF